MVVEGWLCAPLAQQMLCHAALMNAQCLPLKGAHCMWPTTGDLLVDIVNAVLRMLSLGTRICRMLSGRTYKYAYSAVTCCTEAVFPQCQHWVHADYHTHLSTDAGKCDCFAHFHSVVKAAPTRDIGLHATAKQISAASHCVVWFLSIKVKLVNKACFAHTHTHMHDVFAGMRSCFVMGKGVMWQYINPAMLLAECPGASGTVMLVRTSWTWANLTVFAAELWEAFCAW